MGEPPGTDEWFDAFLKAHPLDPMQQEEVERGTQNIVRKLRGEPGPTLNL